MSQYILDSDSASNYIDTRRTHPALRKRILGLPPETMFITVITVEEVLSGLLAAVQLARKNRNNPAFLFLAYDQLSNFASNLLRFQILGYDEAAEDAFQKIPENIRKRRPQDCRIAAIALARGYIVVTSNLRDFAGIPGLSCEDWTQDENESESA